MCFQITFDDLKFLNTQGLLLHLFCVFMQILFMHIVLWILCVCFELGFLLFVGELYFGLEVKYHLKWFMLFDLCVCGQW
jgi:hypothetical protein